MQHDDDIAAYYVPVDGIAHHDAIATQGDTHGDAQRHGNAQAPDAYGATGDLIGLDRHRDQRWLGDGGAEADHEGEDIDPEIIPPVECPGGAHRVVGGLDEGGVGQLPGHQPAQGEQAPLQAQQEQRQPQQYPGEAPQDGRQVGRYLAQHEKLEPENNPGNGQYVGDRAQGDLQDGGEDIHQIIMP